MGVHILSAPEKGPSFSSMYDTLCLKTMFQKQNIMLQKQKQMEQMA